MIQLLSLRDKTTEMTANTEEKETGNVKSQIAKCDTKNSVCVRACVVYISKRRERKYFDCLGIDRLWVFWHSLTGSVLQREEIQNRSYTCYEQSVGVGKISDGLGSFITFILKGTGLFLAWIVVVVEFWVSKWLHCFENCTDVTQQKGKSVLQTVTSEYCMTGFKATGIQVEPLWSTA